MPITKPMRTLGPAFHRLPAMPLPPHHITGNVADNGKHSPFGSIKAFMQALTLGLKVLKFLQKMIPVLNIVFPGGEHATNLIIANMEVLSHDNRNSHSFLQRVSIACYAERCISYSKSVRLSVCPSHAGTESKRHKLRSWGLHWRIAP